MAIYEYQVQPLNLYKTGKHVDSHKMKRYQDRFRYILKQNNHFANNIDISLTL